jgi:hypothetical protein
MGSPTLLTLQEPILLLPWVCFRGGGFPNPSAYTERLWACALCHSGAVGSPTWPTTTHVAGGSFECAFTCTKQKSCVFKWRVAVQPAADAGLGSRAQVHSHPLLYSCLVQGCGEREERCGSIQTSREREAELR